MKSTLVFIVLSVLVANAFSFESSGSSGLAGEYLYNLSGGARGIGMGLAQTAVSGNSSDVYANPASVASIWWQEAGITYVPLFYNTQFVNLSYGYPIKPNQAISANLVRLVSGDAEKTNELGQTMGTFSDQQSAVVVGYGYKYTKLFHIGASAKIVSQDIDTYSKRGFGVDFGAIYHVSREHAWALSLMNLIPPRVGPDQYPFVAKLGFYHAFIRNKFFMSADVSNIKTLDSKGSVNKWYCGFEYFPVQLLAIRAGMNQKQYSAGLGVKTRKVDFDYAFSYNQLDIFHAVTFNVRYGFEPTSAERDVETKWDDLKAEKENYKEEVRKRKAEIESEKEQLKIQIKLSSMFMAARRKYEEGNFKESKEIVLEMLRIDKSNREATQLLSEIRAKTDDVEIMRRMKDAKAYYENGDYDSAIREAGFVLGLKPGFQDAVIVNYLSASQKLINEKKYREAKGDLIEVIKLDPENKEANDLIKRLQTILDVYEQ